MLAELRLVFAVIADPRLLHEAYLPRNREILELVRVGKVRSASEQLHRYPNDAQRQLLAAYDADAPGADLV